MKAFLGWRHGFGHTAEAVTSKFGDFGEIATASGTGGTVTDRVFGASGGNNITSRYHRNGHPAAMAVATSWVIGPPENCVFHHFGISSSTQAASRDVVVQQNVDQSGKGSTSCIQQVPNIPLLFPVFAAPGSIQE